MNNFDWISFGIRAAIELGSTAFQLVQAMQQGDVSTVESLGKVLPPADRVIANAEAHAAKVRKQWEQKQHG